jgi:hypothetical protein
VKKKGKRGNWQAKKKETCNVVVGWRGEVALLLASALLHSQRGRCHTPTL